MSSTFFGDFLKQHLELLAEAEHQLCPQFPNETFSSVHVSASGVELSRDAGTLLGAAAMAASVLNAYYGAMTSDEKGIALEIAVHSIEAVILESSPSLRGQPFQIERRKRIVVGEVHHEIDVFVTVGAATGYEATFIFECKKEAHRDIEGHGTQGKLYLTPEHKKP